jgi:hypothetical protein
MTGAGMYDTMFVIPDDGEFKDGDWLDGGVNYVLMFRQMLPQKPSG